MGVLGNRRKEINDLKQKIAGLEEENTRLHQLVKDSSIKENPLINVTAIFMLLNIAETGIWTWHPETEKLWLSSSARDIFGYKNGSPTSLEQMKVSILPEDRPAFDKAVADVSQGFRIPEFETKIARTDGEGREFRIVAINLTGIPQDEGKKPALAGIIRDITRQDKLKRDLLKAKDKAEESEKLKNTILTNISHDIRTPMNSIIGFSELLNIGNLAYDKRVEYVRTIKNQGILLLKMIDDVVELTRMETGKVTIRKSPCNLELLMNELLASFNQYKISQNKEHLEIRVIYPENKGITIFTDPGRLQQLIWSLISNSVKY